MMERGVWVVELHGGRRRGVGIIFKGGRGMAGRPAEVDSLISGAGRMGWGIDYYSLAWPGHGGIPERNRRRRRGR